MLGDYPDDINPKIIFRSVLIMAELKYEIVKECGVLSQSPTGWTKELNLISWNDRAPKYDIRDWAPERTKMGKGVTVSADEVILLRDLLNELDL